MKFPTIPHNFPWKTFREVFNRLLNGYLLENEQAFQSPYSWGIREDGSQNNFYLSITVFLLCRIRKKGRRY